MFRILWIIFAILPCLASKTDQSEQLLPSTDCHYIDLKLVCVNSRALFPSTFSVEQIPEGITRLHLGCAAVRGHHCNILETNFQPLPYRANLTSVFMLSVDSPGHDRIPVPQFLHNVKATIEYLTIQYSKISFLDAAFLDGFSALQYIDFSYNDITNIDVGTFHPLTYQPVGLVLSDDQFKILNGLQQIDLTQNRIESFDWSTLKPIKNTLLVLRLSNQTPKLQTLYQSGSVFSHKLYDLRLEGNNLTGVPDRILRSIQPYDGPTHYNFAGNPFCPDHADCSCCEMEAFVARMHDIVKASPTSDTIFSCGSKTQLTVYVNTSLPSLSLYDKCERASIASATCQDPSPLVISCKNGYITFSETDFRKTDATMAVFHGDKTQQCRMILHDAFQNLVDISTFHIHAKPNSPTGRDRIEAQCMQGSIRLEAHEEYFDEDEEDFDPTHFTATSLTFEIDTTYNCRQLLTKFLLALHELTETGEKVSSIAVPLVPIEQWLRSSLVCSKDQPLQLKCRNGNLDFPLKTYRRTTATSFIIQSDGGPGCDALMSNMYDHILLQRQVLVLPPEHDPYPDGIVVVCQKGLLLISEQHPHFSAKKDLHIYSAPNQLCWEKYIQFLDYLGSHAAITKEI
ncbi:uncharacterized protein LOC129594880 [Paramacrobiotus metropolitanus]|uniref:uncharacterized protein LOC129594880 n=1 Tax=Paramacrobiotus metropolitanus TaxID=2943436 RepID=UPI0024459E60|nr:uncharacterized protein LOC129594880 [Paramacrobiotus metropolitanus]